MATIKKQLTLTFKQPNIAESYGPYVSVSEAHAALSEDQLNVIGMTVGIQTGNTIEEYWYQGGTTELHLVKKQSASIEVDSTPTQNSTNAVSSGGVYTALQAKANTSDIPTISTNITTDATSDTKTASPKSVKTYVDNGLTGKQNTISASNTINSDFVDDTNGTNKFVTSTEKGLISTAIQGVKKGTETLTPENGIVTIPSDIESANATSVASNQSATASIDSNHVLQLGIPRGADAVNPFKGWFDDTTALNTAYPSPVVGDYAYIPDAAPATTASIYKCATAGTWADSGKKVDTSNVQTFGSGQQVNQTYISEGVPTEGSQGLATAANVYKGMPSNEVADNNTDLDILDELGNVIMRLSGGHIRTKNFNSNDVKFKTINILAIGNSYTCDAFNYIGEVLGEALRGIAKFNIVVLYYGGAGLQEHYGYVNDNSAVYTMYQWTTETGKWAKTTATAVNTALALADWDCILTEEKSIRVDDYSNYQPYLNNLLTVLSGRVSKTVKFGIVMSRGTSSSVFSSIATATKKAYDETLVDFVIPAGTAVFNARTTSLDSLGEGGHLTYDSTHLQDGLPCLIETYASTMVLLDVFGYSYIGLNGSQFRPTQAWTTNKGMDGQENGQVVGVTESNVRLALACADMSVKHPYVITDCGDLFE